MLFCDLMRATVLLTGALATVLGAVSVIAASAENDTTALIVAAAWWLIAAIAGVYAGRSNSAGEAMARTLAGARTMTSLPAESPARIGFSRLWPILAFGLICGGLAVLFPPVAVIGTGYAIGVALMMRRREAAVTAIEERDGVTFFVERTSPFAPVSLVRMPGLRREVPELFDTPAP